jgi:dolichyl-phosphate-mannose--protein O-mannosyl transferase
MILFVFLIGFTSAAESPIEITYGSAVKLATEGSTRNFLRSFDVQWNGRKRNGNIVTTVSDETNPEIYWVVGPSATSPSLSGDVVMCGGKIKLVHAVTGKELAADLTQRSNLAGMYEVTAVGETGDEFVVECLSQSGSMWSGSAAKEKWEKGDKVQLKHVSGGYLRSSPNWVYNQHNCARCPMIGDHEVVVTGPGSSGMSWIVEGGVVVRNPVPDESDHDTQGKDEL